MQLIWNVAWAQKADADAIIVWTEGRRLSMNDFQLVKDNTTRLDHNVTALTRTGITYYLSVNGSRGMVQITVKATVHKAHTFLKEKVLKFTPVRRAQLLGHEQKHFDISEVFARRTVKELQTLRLTKNYKDEITRFVNEKFKEAEAYQHLYDRETQHGENIDAQVKWDRVIADELKAFDPYKKKIVLRKVN